MKSIKSRQRQKVTSTSLRAKWVLVAWYLSFFILLCRLFYWQIIKGSSLQAVGENQYTSFINQKVSRGQIFTADDYLLVGNKQVYKLTADPSVIDQDSEQLSQKITDLLIDEVEDYKQASQSAVQKEIKEEVRQSIENKLNQKDKKWVALKNKISQDTKDAIEGLDIYGLGFEGYEVRYYPEASSAAHLTGFVGKDDSGEEIGYFGLEGALDKELKGVATTKQRLKDALGLDLIFSKFDNKSEQGRDFVITIRRDIQLMAENQLKKAIEKYGAKSGDIVIMDPRTGEILALAAYPNYDQSKFYDYDPSLYKNPSLADTYEPGSTFKALTVSAGINEDVITPDTQCPACAGPVTIGKYTIRTWDDNYFPNTTMTEALEHSDNTAMIYIAQLLGKEKFIDYLNKFKIGQKIDIDLQEDTSTPLREKWGDIDLAVNSFGQGIVTNSMQMVRAVGAIANDGQMVRPMIIKKVIDPETGEEMEMKTVSLGQVISPQAAQEVKKMMIASAAHGEAQWTYSKDHTVAGKTGTSQVAVDGEYDSEKTIASFIGFAPVDDPKFVMMVKLNEPTVSPWAAETAAPTWFQIANKLFLFLNIPPDQVVEESEL